MSTAIHHVDPYTEADALECARAAWGARGWAHAQRSYLGTEGVNDAGFRAPQGPIHSYEIGYYRAGKKGGRPSTVAGSSGHGWGDAIQSAMNRLRSGTQKRARFLAKAAELQRKYQAEGKIR